MPIMSVYQLPLHQYRIQWACYQPTTDFVCSLPRMSSQLYVVVVRRESAAGSHKNFKVRHSRVLQVLQWLMENNPYFCRISLDHAALAQLLDWLLWPCLMMKVALKLVLSKVKSIIVNNWACSFVPATPCQATGWEGFRAGSVWPAASCLPFTLWRPFEWISFRLVDYTGLPNSLSYWGCRLHCTAHAHCYYFKHLMYSDGTHIKKTRL